jgi:phosphoesterase RecJ-like protein
MLHDSESLFGEISKIIKNNEKFLIVTHDFPDGDSLGCQIAVFELLCNLNKKALMFCNSDIPYQYEFLPHINKIKKSLGDLDTYFLEKNCICVCLDSADERRFKLDVECLRQKSIVIINVDHHLGNTEYGDINIVNPKKSATAEILYELIDSNFKDLFNYNIAVGIYTGILTDTGRFQYENTTSSVHKIVSHLLELGVDPPEVFSYVYENEPLNRFKLLEIALKRICVLKSKNLIYSYLLKKDFEKLSLPFSAHDGVIELLRSASDAKIAALFKQVGRGHFKISLRSSDTDYNVAEIASRFGGGGHKRASAYSEKGSLKDVISNLINTIDS